MSDIPGINDDRGQTIQGISSVAISSRIPTSIAVNPSTHAMLVEASFAPSGTQDVNVTQIGGATFSLGQQLAAVSLPVVLTAAQISTLTPLSTVAVTQSGTWNITNISGTISLPTGAATSALQTQPGVDIGDVTINNASGAGAVNIQDGGNSITVDGTVAFSNSTIAVTNAGTFVVQATLAAETTKVIGTVNQGTSPWIVAGGGTAGTAATGVVTVQGIASMTPVQVSQATAASLNATVVGTGTFAVQADTELPAAVALSDAIANPTAPAVGAYLMGLQSGGTTWARIASDNADGDVNSASIFGIVTNSRGQTYNGSTWDLIRGGAGAVGAGVQRIVQANDAGKTLVSKSGSAASNGNNTLVVAGTNRLKVHAFSLSTSSTTALTVKFQDGASGTDLWSVLLQAPTSVTTGANLAVSPPAWLFATSSATLLNLNLSSANPVQWSISYVDEP